MKRVSLEDAEKQLKELVAAAAAGEDVVITGGEGLRARLVAAEELVEPSEIHLGTLRGQIEIDPSFYDDMDERDLVVTTGGRRLGSLEGMVSFNDPDWDKPLSDDEIREWFGDEFADDVGA